MKPLLTTLAAALIGSLLIQVPSAQLFGPQQIITAAADQPQSVFAADVDGDGDLDALKAGNTIAWHENLAGDGSSWSTHVISTSGSWAISVFAADVDGDGDLDALSASISDDKVTWYENLAGDGSSWSTHVISTTAVNPHSVFAADVDGDGDFDVLSANATAFSYPGISWYENLAGDGSSWSTHVISTTLSSARSVYCADVDGDGDLDALSASFNDYKIAWHENLAGDGSSWSTHVISTTFASPFTVHAADVDGDGDLDALSGGANAAIIAWHENLAGDGSSWSTHVIPSATDGALSLFAADVDGDGDCDVLAASCGFGVNRVAWYENLVGDGSSWSTHGISTSACGASVFAADLDGDGDLDALSASFDDKIAWYENLSPAVVPYGCGVNPAGSMTVISGVPSIGTTVTLGVDNPLGTQAPGSLPFLALATAPDPAFPCGTLVPGFGMGGGGAPGELLLGVAPPPFLVIAGASWAGPGTPAPIALPIPADATLLGASFYAQGLLLDTSPGASVSFGLTDAVELQVGP